MNNPMTYIQGSKTGLSQQHLVWHGRRIERGCVCVAHAEAHAVYSLPEHVAGSVASSSAYTHYLYYLSLGQIFRYRKIKQFDISIHKYKVKKQL